ncbi:molybdopterin-dependent oxidoreductase [Alkalihalophilus pseudofirmus]|uniref:molybdopterin-dependent oxidoreductase n=1 Tax=Alkalihalophilus pseudofirmus TaxID=79885 RepID=UPI0009FA2CE0
MNHPKDMNMTKLHTVCPHNCPDTCGLTVGVRQGVVQHVTGQASHPVTKGVICEKVRHYPKKIYSEKRLKKPLKRIGEKGEGKFAEISWSQAIAEISTELLNVKKRYGGRSILPYSYSGTIGVIQNASMDRRFFNRLNSAMIERTICSAAGNAAFLYTMGAQVGLDPEDTVHSSLIIIWGANTLLTNIHQWLLIEEARKKGAKVIVIDVERTETAKKADQYIQVSPGTDGVLALGLIHVLFEQELVNQTFIRRHTIGVDHLKEEALAYTPEYVEEMTGVKAEVLKQLAIKYAAHKASFIRIGNGQQHHTNGGMNTRAILCLPALTGAWQHRGGGAIFFNLSQGRVNSKALEQPDLRTEKAKLINMNSLGEALVARKDPVKALFVYNSNPASVNQDQMTVLEGLKRKDIFTVVHEQTMTETAMYADYVLPATTAMEHLDLYKSYWHRYWQIGKPVIKPLGEAVCNTELFRRLADACGFKEECFLEDDDSLIRQAIIDKPKHWQEDLLAGKTVKWPLEDVDDVEPWTAGDYLTPSGKIEFYSEQMKQHGLPPVPSINKLMKRGEDEWWLLSSPHRRGLNSQFLSSFYDEGEEEPLAVIHPKTAGKCKIVEHDTVSLFNRNGSIEVKVKVDDRVAESVIMIRGVWPHKAFGGKNTNALTTNKLSDFGGGATYFTTLVKISKKQ